jgi:hypothetical protein
MPTKIKNLKPAPQDWRTMETEGEPDRLVVDENNCLVADCNPATAEDLGLPEDYRANARRIASLPTLHALLANCERAVAYYDEHEGAPELLNAVRAALK